MRRFLFSLLILTASVLLFNACGDDDDVDPKCECPASSPWSKPGVTDCYATQAACESAQGGTCQICN